MLYPVKRYPLRSLFNIAHETGMSVVLEPDQLDALLDPGRGFQERQVLADAALDAGRGVFSES